MKSTSFAIALAGCLLGSVAPALAQTQPVTPPPTNPGPWQPIALVNPRQAVKVEVINRTSDPIDYGLSNNEAPPRSLAVGDTATLSQFSLPTYLLISPTQSDVSLKFNVQVKNNTVTVEVSPRDRTTPGDTTLNINARGGVYVY